MEKEEYGNTWKYSPGEWQNNSEGILKQNRRGFEKIIKEKARKKRENGKENASWKEMVIFII